MLQRSRSEPCRRSAWLPARTGCGLITRIRPSCRCASSWPCSRRWASSTAFTIGCATTGCTTSTRTRTRTRTTRTEDSSTLTSAGPWWCPIRLLSQRFRRWTWPTWSRTGWWCGSTGCTLRWPPSCRTSCPPSCRGGCGGRIFWSPTWSPHSSGKCSRCTPRSSSTAPRTCGESSRMTSEFYLGCCARTIYSSSAASCVNNMYMVMAMGGDICVKRLRRSRF